MLPLPLISPPLLMLLIRRAYDIFATRHYQPHAYAADAMLMMLL